MKVSHLSEINIIDVVGRTSKEERDNAKGNGHVIYQIRHSDDDMTLPVTIEKSVVVNHYCDIILHYEIDLNGEDFVYLSESDVQLLRGIF